MSNWTTTVKFCIEEALKNARSAAACSEADPADDLGDVQGEVEIAIRNLETAHRMVTAALEEDPSSITSSIPHRCSARDGEAQCIEPEGHDGPHDYRYNYDDPEED